MAANTVTAQDILFKVARDVGESISEFVSSVTSTTVFNARGILRDPHVSYKAALAQVAGKGIRTITAWDPSNEQITVNSAFSSAIALNDQVEVVGWDATRRRLMFAAINEAIRVSFPWWWRETVVNAASSTITLAAGTDVYNLPTDCSALIGIGIQPSATEPIKWYYLSESPDWFSVEGQEGAFQVRFTPSLTREGGFHEIYTGKKLCTKYAVREPEMTDESGSTQLPLAYFVVASMAYQMWTLGKDNMGNTEKGQLILDLQKYQQLAQVAQTELQKLLIAKVPPNPLVQQQVKESAKQKAE